jgi:hypothetical protein
MIGVQLLQRTIDSLAECDAMDLVQHGVVTTFTDPVGLGMLRVGPRKSAMLITSLIQPESPVV